MSASSAIIIDGVLKELGDRLFYQASPPMRARRTIKGTLIKLGGKTKYREVTATTIRATLDRTVRRIPEVMVKISGNGKSLKHIKAHFDYISRNGTVPLEDHYGETILGKDDVRYLEREWRDGGIGISDDGARRESFNIVLSMPPGTDRAAVTSAVREFAKDEFSENYSYVFATHEDEKHPHVHLCVKAMGHNGTRLNPRKADLQHWRESFAEKLRDNGIEANATKRQVRGKVLKATKQPVLHIQKREQSLNRRGQTAAVIEAIKTGFITPNPHASKINQTRALIVDLYNKIDAVLSHSNQAGDQILSKEISAFTKALPTFKSAREMFLSEYETQRSRAEASRILIKEDRSINKNKDIEK